MADWLARAIGQPFQHSTKFNDCIDNGTYAECKVCHREVPQLPRKETLQNVLRQAAESAEKTGAACNGNQIDGHQDPQTNSIAHLTLTSMQA
mmetsp:Transcript_58267/g.104304  ORF Transcript_58267/g.104304 Transcript_58267/m.104304 type:complete len:92 (-) Transcript_58267:18-293(-)